MARSRPIRTSARRIAALTLAGTAMALPPRTAAAQGTPPSPAPPAAGALARPLVGIWNMIPDRGQPATLTVTAAGDSAVGILEPADSDGGGKIPVGRVQYVGDSLAMSFQPPELPFALRCRFGPTLDGNYRGPCAPEKSENKVMLTLLPPKP